MLTFRFQTFLVRSIAYVSDYDNSTSAAYMALERNLTTELSKSLNTSLGFFDASLENVYNLGIVVAE